MSPKDYWCPLRCKWIFIYLFLNFCFAFEEGKGFRRGSQINLGNARLKKKVKLVSC